MLKEVGITAIGDIMAILRQVKKQNQVGVLYINRHDMLEVNNICYEFFKYRGAAVKVMKTTLNHPQPKKTKVQSVFSINHNITIIGFFSVEFIIKVTYKLYPKGKCVKVEIQARNN